MNQLKLQEILKDFFIEDVGERDITSTALFSEDDQGTFSFFTKADGIFCGKPVIETGFRLVEPNVQLQIYVTDGQPVQKGQKLADISGAIRNLLIGERVVLNLVQKMSGIATAAHQAAEILAGTHTKPCDTRKTTPGLRMLEKYAVRCGGASNHRYGLYDAVMIKDNHIDFMGGIHKAVEKARSQIGHTVKIEVEISNQAQLLEAIDARADIIMFDNCTPEEIAEMIPCVPEGIITEASGGITLNNLATYKNTGVDYISLGCLTHSVTALDISARVEIFKGGNAK